MNNRLLRKGILSLAVATTLSGIATASHAQAAYHVSLDTSSLSSGYTGPLYLDFQILDGGDPGHNTATINDFSFGTGGSGPADDSGVVSTGTASGGLSSGTISLTDDAGLNDLYEPFTPGSTLNFDVNLTTFVTSDPSAGPDAFSFSILDGSQNPIATNDPTTANSLLAIDIDSSTPTSMPYTTMPDANNVSITPTVTPAPEPTPGLVFSLGLVCLAGIHIRARRHTK